MRSNRSRRSSLVGTGPSFAECSRHGSPDAPSLPVFAHGHVAGNLPIIGVVDTGTRIESGALARTGA
jgi:hypothetical protein